MATSGSVDLNATRDQVIQEALENLGIMVPGDTTSSASFTDHSAGLARLLNGIVKQYANPTDGSPGIQVYHLKRAFLFLQKGQSVYTLGPTSTETGSTNKWASSYVLTTLSADEAASQTALSVTSDSGILDTHRIGIELNSGSIHWTTVNGNPAANVVDVDTALSGAASAGNRVIAYATTLQGRRPLEIKSVLLRDSDDNDVPLTPMSLMEYEHIPSKNTQSTPTRYYYEASLTDGTLYLDCAVSDVTDVLRITYRSPPEDLDAAANDIDFDQVWIAPLGWALTLSACGRFGQEGRAQYFKTMRDDTLAIARNANPETNEMYFCPGEAG